MNKALVLLGIVSSVSTAAVVMLQTAPTQTARPTHAVALIAPTQGNKVEGLVTFVQTDGGVRVTGEVRGLPANSKHGFHIHEFGDMTVKDGTGMGSHFNPAGSAHGLPTQTARHAGDMGNIQSDANGVAKIDMTIEGMNVAGRNNILGRGVVVHEKADDGSQPVGNAGARIGFGVIGVAKAP